jgi:diguanylate cyclase (GGDEF)-like protein
LAVFIVILTVPLGFLIMRRIVEPVNELAGAVASFASGNLSARSTVRRRDEIGKLADGFNRMADQHQRNHEQLVTLNAELEERVHQRTRQLHELAARDPLTALYNRRHFAEVLVSRFHEARRYGTPLSCLMMDLDDFKLVNDNFGHHTGDELLLVAANTITGQLRASDMAARFGGDEFVVLLPQTATSRAELLGARIAEKLTAAVREKLPHLRMSMSVGVSGLEDLDSDDPEELIRSADRAMYTAKAEGKNRIVSTAVAAVG